MTTKELTTETAAEEFAAAEQREAALRQRIARGEDVTQAELSAVQHGLDLARMRVEAAESLDADRTEAQRQRRIEALRKKTTSGSLQQKSARVVELFDQAVEVLTALRQAAAEQQAELRSVTSQLQTLGDLPPSMEVSDHGQRLFVDGTDWRLLRDVDEELMIEAAIAAGAQRRTMEQVSGRPTTAIEAFRFQAETEPDPTARTPGTFVTVRYTDRDRSSRAGRVRRERWSSVRGRIEKGLAELVIEEEGEPDEAA